MPIYEYQCRACGRTFEYQQRMTEDPKTVCESCGGALERLISRTAFTLKGGGWYKDLYSSPKPGGDSSKSGDSGGSSTSTDSKPADSKPTESKPAAATESKPAPKKAGD
jgi:putative FmdB family regulatory protein